MDKDNRGFREDKLKFNRSKYHPGCSCCHKNTRKYELVIKYRRRIVHEEMRAELSN